MIGYDNLNVNMEMLLDLRVSEATGTNAQDWAKAHHLSTLTGAPSWANLDNGLTYLDFVAGNPDYILGLQAATADLNFTSGDFSLAVWIRPDLGGNRFLFQRGLTQNDGYGFLYNTDEALQFSTNQAAAAQHTIGAAASVVVGTWSLAAVSRAGATAELYTNGVRDIATIGTHIDPLTAPRNLYIGVNNGAGAGWYDGDLWRPRIWGRALSAAEMLAIFEYERDLFGV
jgi:hypothetical protein